MSFSINEHLNTIVPQPTAKPKKYVGIPEDYEEARFLQDQALKARTNSNRSYSPINEKSRWETGIYKHSFAAEATIIYDKKENLKQGDRSPREIQKLGQRQGQEDLTPTKKFNFLNKNLNIAEFRDKLQTIKDGQSSPSPIKLDNKAPKNLSSNKTPTGKNSRYILADRDQNLEENGFQKKIEEKSPLEDKIKGVKNVLEMNVLHFENVVEIFEKLLEVEKKTIQGPFTDIKVKKDRETLVRSFERNISDLQQLLKENQICSKDLSDLDFRKILDKKEKVSESNSSSSNSLNRQEKNYLRRKELQEENLYRVADKASELDKLSGEKGGLVNIAKKLIEFEKRLQKSQQEKIDIEMAFEALKQENERQKEAVLKIKQKYGAYIDLDFDGIEKKNGVGFLHQEEIDTASMFKEYIKKIEEELTKAKEEINVLQQNSNGNEVEVNLMIDQTFQGEEEEDKNDLPKLNLENFRSASTPSTTILSSHKNSYQSLLSKNSSTSQIHHHPKSLTGDPDKFLLMQDALENLHSTFMKNSKLVYLSDPIKKIIKDTFTQQISKIMNKYENRITLLKNKIIDLQENLKIEVHRHIVTLLNQKKCFEPLLEFISILDEIRPIDLGANQIGRFAQNLLKKRKDILMHVKGFQETQQTIKMLWKNKNIDDINESHIPFDTIYKTLEEKLKNEGEKDEAILTKEEADFLKREVAYLNKKVESLRTHNQELVNQMGRMKSKFEGLRERYLSPINTPRGESKLTSFKSPTITTIVDEVKSRNDPLEKYITEENNDESRSTFQDMLEGKNTQNDFDLSPLSVPVSNIDVENMLQMLLLQSQLIETKITANQEF